MARSSSPPEEIFRRKTGTDRLTQGKPRQGIGRNCRARQRGSCERRLFQETRKGSTCSGFELLGINRSFIVGIGRSEIAAVDPTTQFAFVESAVVIAIELIE